jgi:hypothetical protein
MSVNKGEIGKQAGCRQWGGVRHFSKVRVFCSLEEFKPNKLRLMKTVSRLAKKV